MRKNLFGILGGLLALLPVSGLRAQDSPKPVKHHVVVQVNFNGKDQWDELLRNVENLKKALGPDGGIEVEIVTHGKGVDLLTTKDPDLQARLKALADSGDIIAACGNTCRKKNLTAKNFGDYVRIVDAGVAEIVRKQEQGWSYLKGGSGF
jgi:intracellular sulfur oxidation DsrE/DsrF family protein